jgi:hypothetical protein
MNFIKGRKNKTRWTKNLSFKDFQVIAALLSLGIFVCGFWVRSINLDSSNSNNKVSEILLPLFITFFIVPLFIFLTNDYVKGNIENIEKKCDEEVRKKFQEYENALLNMKGEYENERLKMQREIDNGIYRQAQELEFLSILFQDSIIPQDSLNYKVFCTHIRELHQSSELSQELKRYIQKLKGREEALEGLSKGFKEDENGKCLFYGLVGPACRYALNIQEDEIQKYRELAHPFYLDIFAYLKAWLVCSIKHEVPIPIKPFVIESLGEDLNDRYHGTETYITAIQRIREAVLEDEGLKPFFNTPASRSTVDHYLGELINLLRSEKKSSPINHGVHQSSSPI